MSGGAASETAVTMAPIGTKTQYEKQSNDAESKNKSGSKRHLRGYTGAMLMVIFGAGASYDSAPAFRPSLTTGGPWRPPLAKDLFADTNHAFGTFVQNYPKLAHILPYLRQPSNGRSVEQVLENLVEQGKENPEAIRELASVRFYLCELLHNVTQKWLREIDRVTNYAPLIREILRFNKTGEEICLVTFNYDLLLENALYSFDFKSRDPVEQLDSHPILKLFKLHGSVNWSRLVDLPEGARLQPQTLIQQADTIRLTDLFVRANATEPNEMYAFAKPVFPAIAIPVQTKSEQYFECPVAHRNYLVEMLPHVTKILIIGWQAKEAHFLGMLRSRIPLLRHVMIIGAKEGDARETLTHFLAEIKPPQLSSVSFAHEGFTEFIVNREGDSFFSA